MSKRYYVAFILMAVAQWINFLGRRLTDPYSDLLFAVTLIVYLVAIILVAFEVVYIIKEKKQKKQATQDAPEE